MEESLRRCQIMTIPGRGRSFGNCENEAVSNSNKKNLQRTSNINTCNSIIIYMRLQNCVVNSPENGAGEGLLLEPERAPDLCERRHEDAEAEGPGEGDHEEDVGLRVDAAVVGVAGDQHIPAIGQLEYNDKHV